MILQSIHIEGFRSYARPTEVEFGYGVNAMVGPKGGEKTNLLRAIAWAFGFRTEQGDEIFFKGTDKHSPATRAVVTIALGDKPWQGMDFEISAFAHRESPETLLEINGERYVGIFPRKYSALTDYVRQIPDLETARRLVAERTMDCVLLADDRAEEHDADRQREFQAQIAELADANQIVLETNTKMSSIDFLFGVTMVEPGVSSVMASGELR